MQHLKKLIRINQYITGRPVYAGNDAKILVDGPMAFDAMFAAMKQSRHHIHIETFIFDDEKIGQQFADILLERRKADVEVRIVYDALGAFNAEEAFFKNLEAAGVQLLKHHPVDPSEDVRFWRVNQRHHRKILIIDGRTAFIGGMNISGVYGKSSFGLSP